MAIPLTKTQLLAIAPVSAKTMAVAWQPLLDTLESYAINTPKRIAAFLAQVLHESGNLSILAENLNYSDATRIAKIFRSGFDLDKDRIIDPEEIEFAKKYVRQPEKLASRAYANRMGNGNEASGDGWRYRGSGWIQTTGHDNFVLMSKRLNVNFLTNPEWLRTYPYAALSAGAFWNENKFNVLADIGTLESFIKISKGVNLGNINSSATPLGNAERNALFTKALAVLTK